MMSSNKIIASLIIPMMMLSPPNKANSKTFLNDKKENLIEVFNDNNTNKDNSDTLIYEEIQNLSLEEIRTVLLKEINQFRIENNVAPLELDTGCNLVASKYSNYLFINGMDKKIEEYDHYDKKGNDIMDRFKDSGLLEDMFFVNVGENILPTIGNTISNIMIKQKGSLIHRNNLLSKTFGKIGIGHKKGSNNLVIVFINKKNK